MGTPTLVCVRSCHNLVLQLVGPLDAFLYIVSCVMIDHYVALSSFLHCQGVTDLLSEPSASWLVAESRGGGTDKRVGSGGRGRGPRGGNDERVDELNGQGNDQDLGANRGVKGVNRNVEGVNGGVGGAPDFSTIIAQQLQNLLPAMLAQVGNQGNVGSPNDNVVNIGNVLVNGNWLGCSYKEFLALTLRNMMVRDVIHEIQKLETELWNHAMVGAGHAAYTDRFHELARLVPHLVTLESRKIERYVYGLAPQIRGMVEAMEPKTIQKAV
ncbi:hypothetical protein Tco_1177098 [Tanacetum coccineum]